MNEILKAWVKESVPVYYIRFQQAIPPAANMEPVSEFTLKNKHLKYVVDKLWYGPWGALWLCKGELNCSPEANVMYVRCHYETSKLDG